MKTPSTLSSLQISCQQLKWFNTLLLFFLFFFFSTTTSGSALRISYADHCASVVPENTPTVRANLSPPHLTMSYCRGGDKILGKINKSTDLYSDDSDSYVSFYTTGDVFETSSRGIYKFRADLFFQLPLVQYSNYSGYGQNYHPRVVHRPTSLRFLLNGFWSEQSRKVCMVGAASWSSGEGKPLNLEAVLELNYATKNSTVFTSLAKGTLKSLSSSNSQSYFEPIEILSFPFLYDYNYTLASKGLAGAGGCQGGTYIPPKQSLSWQTGGICTRLSWNPFVFDLEYAPSCKSSRDCSPLEVGVATAYMTLYAFQCLENEGKLRYVISFQNNKHSWNFRSFDLKRTLIGEGSWDSERNQLCIVACRILNPFKSLGEVHVGDCSIRLSLRFPAIWTIKNGSSILGLVWTNKTSTEPGYFKSIKFSSSNMNGAASPGLKYEYTETKKVRELCSKHEVKGTGDEYPKGNSYDMRFDMSVEHSKERIAWGYAVPISVGDTLYRGESGDSGIIMGLGPSSYVEVEEATSYSGQMNISYKLTFTAMKFGTQFFSVNSSLNDREQLEISAEGVYDAETGHLCMVGCREFHLPNASKKSLDCEMLIKFQFSPLISGVGAASKGMIQSRREKTDPLYFELLNISSTSFYRVEVQESIWRMDLEIVLVLISNTLLCIFVASQIFYVKKHREVLPFMSLVMLTVLTLGHMIPLVLNLEALLLKNHNQQNVILRGDGWLELNEVSLRLVTLVVFLLLLRLLQLAWTARKENGDENQFWGAEKKTIFVTLLLYAIGGLITLLVEWRKNGIGHGTVLSEVPAPARVLQGNITLSSEPFTSTISQQSSILTILKSYFGLVLDGFLLPQILLNMCRNSRESALSCFFYIGTTIVRLLPHAYDLYRVHYYMRQVFDGSYIYANPNADFYSIAWDLIIPCGCILLALIIWLQQRFGGRCILPRRIRELWSYEKVPVISSE